MGGKEGGVEGDWEWGIFIRWSDRTYHFPLPLSLIPDESEFLWGEGRRSGGGIFIRWSDKFSCS